MDDLDRYLDDLKLRQIRVMYQAEARRAAVEELDYTEYLLRLIEVEHAAKVERSVKYRLSRAGFPVIKHLEGYDFRFQPSLNASLLRRLGQLDFLADAMNVLFVGPAGVGKTHLAIALGVKACQARKRVQFSTAQDLVASLAKAQFMGTLAKEYRRLGRLDLLIIDELGYLSFTAETAQLFFHAIRCRYERGSIILTTNRPFEDWGELFPDTVLATAVLDRLLHHSFVFYVTGESYRLQSHRCSDPSPPPPPSPTSSSGGDTE